jgi:hypothetical protein
MLLRIPDYSKKIIKSDVPEAYRCSFCINENRMVWAYQVESLVQFGKIIDDLQVEKYAEYSGLDKFKAEYETKTTGLVHQLLSLIDLTREAYFSVTCGKKDIYILYRGTFLDISDPSMNNNKPMKLMHFDWSGELLNRYELEVPIINIKQIDFEKKHLYGISYQNDVELVIYDLPTLD